MAMKFAQKVAQMVKEAPVARAGVNVNYGALTVTPMVISFHGKGATPDKRTLAEFADFQEVEIGDVSLSDNDSFQLHMAIHVKELNPGLNFDSYERDIAVVQSSPDGKRKTDWSEVVLPSLEEVFGENWFDELIDAKGNPKPVYVAAESVDSLRTPKDNPDGTPGKNYGVPKFIAKFDSMEECAEARQERYGAPAEGAGDEEEDEEGEGVAYPAPLLKQIYTLYTTNRKSEKNTVALIGKNKQWKQYDAEDLLTAAIEAHGE